MPRSRRILSPLGAITALALCLGACRTDSEDVQRWSRTQQGPTKLVAVLTHAKYTTPLRAEAALTLIGMKPRGGRRVGIDKALEALTVLPESEREQVLGVLVPSLVLQLKQPPAAGNLDDSVAFKDAAMTLLSSESLVKSPEHKAQLREALVHWAMADFATRLEAQGQRVSMQQMLKELGPSSVVGLPDLITANGNVNGRLAQLIAEIGEPETKRRASEKLVEVAQFVASPAWLEARRAQLQEANRVSGIQVDEARFNTQLALFQEEELFRYFESLKLVGQAPAVEFLLSFALDDKRPEKQRAGALAALERGLEKDNPKHLDALVQLAKANATPELVRGLALRRLGDLPRELVAQPLYGLFEHENWKVRWMAAELLLQMSTTDQVPEFLSHLDKVKHQSLTEPLRYGKLLGTLKGQRTPAEIADSYSSSSSEVPSRLVALGYYSAYGTPEQLPKLQAAAKDRRKVPECAEGAQECEWLCGDQQVANVGEFVKLCVVPSIEARKNAVNP